MLAEALTDAQKTHHRFLWGLCYRMTGCAADADEIVQETYARALERSPAVTEARALLPWLVQVSLNLSRDRLRRRHREGYIGPWLPSPIEAGDEPVPDESAPEGRYQLLESVTFAFLLALEKLTPTQRAVLLLCEVFDHSADEAARLLSISAGNVRVILHRAKRAMADYDRKRVIPTRALQAQTRAALEAFLLALTTGDVGAAKALLAPNVEAHSDGAGQYSAAQKILVGPERVTLFMQRLSGLRGAPERYEIQTLNGLAALVVCWAKAEHREPRRAALSATLGPDGLIAAIHTSVADRKLSGIRFPS